MVLVICHTHFHQKTDSRSNVFFGVALISARKSVQSKQLYRNKLCVSQKKGGLWTRPSDESLQ